MARIPKKKQDRDEDSFDASKVSNEYFFNVTLENGPPVDPPVDLKIVFTLPIESVARRNQTVPISLRSDNAAMIVLRIESTQVASGTGPVLTYSMWRPTKKGNYTLTGIATASTGQTAQVVKIMRIK